MVEQGFVDRIKAMIPELSMLPGELKLFAILKMDELTDRWTVMLSSTGLSDATRDEFFFEVRNLLIKHLENTDHDTIARIAMFTTDEHLVELMLDRYKAGDHITSDEKINGNLIHEGYILVAES